MNISQLPIPIMLILIGGALLLIAIIGKIPIPYSRITIKP